MENFGFLIHLLFKERVTTIYNTLPPLPNALPLGLPYSYWKFLPFSTPKSLVHNQMYHCTCYYTFWMEQVNIGTIFNALPRVTTKFLKEKYTIAFFYKTDGNAWYGVDNGTIMHLFLSKCIVTWTAIHLILHRKGSCVEYWKNCLL